MSILEDYRQALRRAGRGLRADTAARPRKPTDAYALGQTGVGPFLLASVGQDARASDLTCLSMLARLGSDPWAEAARLASAPKPAAIEQLSAAIRSMPLDASSLQDATETASRLVALLPGQTQAATGKPPRADARSAAPLSLALIALGLGLLLSSPFLHHRAPPAVPTHAAPIHALK